MNSEKMTEVEIYTDGGELNTTNNRMELTAVITALRALKRPCRVVLHTDSQYVQKGISEWIVGWKARGWRTADKSEVKNPDLWQELLALAERHKVTFVKVKGHSDNEHNNRCDALARAAIKAFAAKPQN